MKPSCEMRRERGSMVEYFSRQSTDSPRRFQKRSNWPSTCSDKFEARLDERAADRPLAP